MTQLHTPTRRAGVVSRFVLLIGACGLAASAFAAVPAGSVAASDAISSTHADEHGTFVLVQDGAVHRLTPRPGQLGVRDAVGAWTFTTLAPNVDPVAAARGRTGFASPVFDIEVDGRHTGWAMATPKVFLGLDPALSEHAVQAAVRTSGLGDLIEMNWHGLPGIHLVRSPATDGATVIESAITARSMAGVRFAEVDMFCQFSAAGINLPPAPVPNDPRFTEQWGLNNTGQIGFTNDGFGPGLARFDVRALDAWAITRGDPSILTVILDVGIDQTHPDLNQIPGMDFSFQEITGGGVGVICDNHGTWVAGRIAAIDDNGLSVSGVAPNTTIASARIGISFDSCDLSFGGELSWTAEAILWARDIGARVTNNSNALSMKLTAIREAYEQTRDDGVVHFGSAGNAGDSGATYPAELGSVVAVGAAERSGERAFFSNFGGGVPVYGPGFDVVSTDRAGAFGVSDGDDTIVDGTSFASPVAAGIAALTLSIDPQLSAIDVENILKRTARDMGTPGFDTNTGWGLLDAAAAIEAAACWRSWRELDGAVPGVRSNPAFATDTDHGEAVLFGGLNVFLASNQTWVLDAAGWRLASTSGPSARYGSAMAHMPSVGTVLLGGFASASFNNEMWVWDGSAWAFRINFGAAPSPRLLAAMAYDAERDALILFGGRDGSGALGENWLWDGADWSMLTSPTSPSSRDGAAMVTDPATGRALLHGGSTGANETWRLDPDGWTLVSTDGPARTRHAMATDPERHLAILTGGNEPAEDASAETWTWDGSTWALQTIGGPGARTDGAAAFNPAMGEVVVIGGLLDGSTISDPWAWSIELPQIIAGPTNERVHAGDPIELSIVADDAWPVSYQWFRNGTPLEDNARVAGATSASLTINTTRFTDTGTYTVQVTGLCGVVSAEPVTVVVTGARFGTVDTSPAGTSNRSRGVFMPAP